MIVDPDARLLGRTPGLPDDVFDHDGLVTKRTLRASAVAHLRPQPGTLLWDVGTGAGSVAIEWCRAVEGARAIGIEAKAVRAERARANAARLTPPGAMIVVDGAAADVLPTLERPDAVFVGGGVSMRVLDIAMDALADGGRLVVHGVTLETELVCAQAYQRWGGELSRIAVEQAAPLGTLTGWTPARTVTQWVLLRGASATAS